MLDSLKALAIAQRRQSHTQVNSQAWHVWHALCGMLKIPRFQYLRVFLEISRKIWIAQDDQSRRHGASRVLQRSTSTHGSTSARPRRGCSLSARCWWWSSWRSACFHLRHTGACPSVPSLIRHPRGSKCQGRLLEEHLVFFGLAACGGAARVRLLTILPRQTRQTKTR